jgi:hypothetical protein
MNEVSMNGTSMNGMSVESTLREAGRQRRKVRARIRFEAESGETEYERSYEPYAIEDNAVIVFSLFRNEFRTIPLADIKRVEMIEGEFRPRRPVQM